MHAKQFKNLCISPTILNKKLQQKVSDKDLQPVLMPHFNNDTYIPKSTEYRAEIKKYHKSQEYQELNAKYGYFPY